MSSSAPSSAESPPIRIGIVRPDRPAPVIATAEARVIDHELRRRLGDVVLDLRVAGSMCAGWLPLVNASWPGGIDTVADATLLWGPRLPPLTALFGRTVEPAAGEVRARMLRHIGIIPEHDYVFDDALVATLPLETLRPTDLWLLARGATAVTTTDPAFTAFASRPGSEIHAVLDTAFDRVAGAVEAARPQATADAVARIAARSARAEAELAAARADLRRQAHELAEQLERLTGENRVLRQRLDRSAG